MTKLSVNINKIATIRNARGGNRPDVVRAVIDCERFGAQGITVHPRPDQRHIRYADVPAIKKAISTEFNIEGNPIDKFNRLVIENHPAQVTLVPDAENVLTSNAGWDTINNKSYLKKICSMFHAEGIRCSIFIDPIPEMVESAAEAGCDRVELYTQQYAELFETSPEKAIEPYVKAAVKARECGLGLNAGHDLNLDNLNYFVTNIPWTDEVSIGHALICDALYMGLEHTVKAYLACLAI